MEAKDLTQTTADMTYNEQLALLEILLPHLLLKDIDRKLRKALDPTRRRRLAKLLVT